MKSLSALFLALVTTISFAQHDHGGSFTNAKAAEISSHRIGRLVDTGKISESFLLNMQQIDVVALPHSSASEPAYQVNVKQSPGQNGKLSELKILLDMKGKFLSHAVLSEVPTVQIEWPDSPVAELIESVLHYVTEQNPAGINIKPFNEKMKSLKVSKKTNSDGTVQAVMTIESSATTQKLEIILSSSGEVQNVGLIN